MALSESWTDILKRARSALNEGRLDFIEFCEHLEGVAPQISNYNESLLPMRRQQEQSLSDADKLCIHETRAALRFALCCFSSKDETERIKIQTLSITEFHLHIPLTILLSQERGDSKCRVFAARLFSNLVASNDVTASVISRDIGLSPSQDELSITLQNTLCPNEECPQRDLLQKPTWVSMLISSRRGTDRDALSAVTAALYNCIVALHGNNQVSWNNRIAGDSMLISTLLRQFISVNIVTQSITRETDIGNSNKESDDWDSATDWIFLVVIRLMNFGMLPTMYRSIAGNGSLSSFQSSTNNSVLPEQNVLLHCAAHEAQTFMDHATRDHPTKNPFGGDIGSESIQASYEFLSSIFCQHYGKTTGLDSTDTELARSAALSCLDVISISLGVDHPDSTMLREYLGETTELLRTASVALGSLVDELTERSNGLKARDLKLSSDEQQWMVSLVRLLGNLCYHCRLNQDRLRLTLVPTARASTIDDSVQSRNALHVVLSCTTFATSCFTLREWVVVAIRNILHENEENQNEVAALDAQNPIQSAALDHAGIRVKMEKGGKVSLSTMDENKES